MYTSYGGELARQRMNQRMREAEVYRLVQKSRRQASGGTAARRGPVGVLLGLLASPVRR